MPSAIPRPWVRGVRRLIGWLDTPWRSLAVAIVVGALGALAVEAFRALLFTAEYFFVDAQGGHLVAAARHLHPARRVLAPALGGLAAGTLLWLAERRRPAAPAPQHGGDYIEAVVIGNGRLDLRTGVLKVAASALVVSTGGAVGREGAMVLAAAMLASAVGRRLGRLVDLRLVVSCGAAAGLAVAYHAPLASAMFVAEILLGSLALSQSGPVMVASVVAYGLSAALHGPALQSPQLPLPAPPWEQSVWLLPLALIGGVAGAGLLHWLALARHLFVRAKLPLPLAFGLGGLIVGLLSLWRPEVWGNGYSTIEQWLTAPGPWPAIALVLALKLVAVAATTGSGAPGGVFTPTLFVGASLGALFASTLAALGAEPAGGPTVALIGMATLLAATTHAPVMAALMVFEMSGQYHLLALMLPACVVATLISQRLHPESVYGLAGAHVPSRRARNARVGRRPAGDHDRPRAEGSDDRAAGH